LQSIKYSYVIFDFSYITSAFKVLYVRIESALKIFYGYELWVFIIKGILWLVDRIKSTETQEQIDEDTDNAHKKNKQKIITTAKNIILRTLPPKSVKQRIKLKLSGIEKSMKDKLFGWRRKK